MGGLKLCTCYRKFVLPPHPRWHSPEEGPSPGTGLSPGPESVGTYTWGHSHYCSAQVNAFRAGLGQIHLCVLRHPQHRAGHSKSAWRGQDGAQGSVPAGDEDFWNEVDVGTRPPFLLTHSVPSATGLLG